MTHLRSNLKSQSKVATLTFLLVVASLNQFSVSFWLLRDFPKDEPTGGNFSSSDHLPTLETWNRGRRVTSAKHSPDRPKSVAAKWVHKPRIFQVDGGQQHGVGMLVKNRTIDAPEREGPRFGMPRPLCEPQDPDCVVPGTWQEWNNMACNPVHEIDLDGFFFRKQDGKSLKERLSIVGKGGKRFVWKFHDFDGSTIALKMFKLRKDRNDDFSPMTIEMQRRDAIIHEIKSASPYIVNLYGYCAASALFEFGDGGQLEENIKKDGPASRNELLQLSHRIAASVADLHHVDGSGKPTIAHADIYGQQWIKVNGEYQLTDFNLAKLLRRSRKTNSTIPFRRDVIDNWFSPEVHRQKYVAKDIGTEKMDIWNMGNVLYLIFTGQPPFDGLSRSEGHSMIVKNHSSPEIPMEKRQSQDYVDQTLVKAIDMCMKRDPEQRATARQVANFLEASISYPTEEERNNRSTRFPGIEERVKWYMSSWYTPPCPDDTAATLQYRFLPKEGSSWRKVVVWELANGNEKKGHVVEIDSEISNDAMMIEPAMLNDTTLPHAGFRSDFVHTVLPIIDYLDGKPLLTQWGDRVSLHLENANSSLALPHLKKCRPAITKSELNRVTAASCYGADRPHVRSIVRKHNVHEPIIWKMDSHRLQGPMSDLPKADKPWAEKQTKAIFRGKLTGHPFDQVGTKHASARIHRGEKTDEEYCHALERCRLVLKHHNSSLVDARLTDLLEKRLSSTISGVDLLGEKMEMQDLLDFKVLIVLEGNDVSSSLRWALRSNSLVMMPKPTFSSWAMEELLVPWVHYIPLDPSFDDTEEKMQWVLQNDEEAEKIAYRGSLWMKDLLEHPDAEKDNMEINKRILERYQRFFVYSDKLGLT